MDEQNEVRDYDKALRTAIKNGDPNKINKVFSDLLKSETEPNKAAVELAATVKDGLRHLRNYAKKRGMAGELLL